jgi:hypothetical protein
MALRPSERTNNSSCGQSRLLYARPTHNVLETKLQTKPTHRCSMMSTELSRLSMVMTHDRPVSQAEEARRCAVCVRAS